MVDVELPEEPKDDFERVAGVIMGTLAVALALISMFGDDAAFDAQVATTRAANKWAHYQAKSIKEHSFALQRELVESISGIDSATRTRLLAKYAAEVARFEKEKNELKADGDTLELEVEHSTRTTSRYQYGSIQLEIALVFGSIALLTRWKAVWRLAVLLGLGGLGTAVWAFVTS